MKTRRKRAPKKMATTYLWLAMRARGVTARVLAGYMGVSTRTVSGWCDGSRVPTDAQIGHVAEMLRIDERYAPFLMVKCNIDTMLTRMMHRMAVRDDLQHTFNEPQDEYPDDPNWSYE